MRINKFLAQCGLGSRRKCEELVLNRQINVNGKICIDLATDISKQDIVTYNENVLKATDSFVYYIFNKPKGYICSAKDEKERKTIYELLPQERRLFSIGRLDYNTEGLIIITDDGNFANAVAHPSAGIEKEYIVKIEGKVLESELAVLRSGVVESDGTRLPKAKVKFIDYDNKNTRLSVVIDEGKNRQIRRMFDSIGRTIILLKRVRIGNLKLGGLTRGKYKETTKLLLATTLGVII